MKKIFEFNRNEALLQGSIDKLDQFKLGESYTRLNFRWCGRSVIACGPKTILRAIKIRNTVKAPVAHKHYNITFRIVFLTYAVITIDILELIPIHTAY